MNSIIKIVLIIITVLVGWVILTGIINSKREDGGGLLISTLTAIKDVCCGGKN